MLIQCPNCKKPVSDQATNCIHCNYLLKQTPTEQPNAEQPKNYPPVDYSKISKREKLELIERFGKDFPVHATVLKKSFNLEKIILFITFSLFVLFACAFLLTIPFATENPLFMPYEPIAMIVAVCLDVIIVILLIVLIIVVVIQIKLRSNEAIAYANLIKWASKNNVSNITPPKYIIIKNEEGK